MAPRVRATGDGSSNAPALLVCSAALALTACGAADIEPVDEGARVQALLSVKRIEDASHAEEPRAHALVQFARLPLEADARTALALAGLQTALPEVDHCFHPPSGEPARSDADSLDHIELLEAGDVNIRAERAVSRLALNLFPLSGAASGVLYTTRDQAAAPLPARARYALEASGSETIPALSVAGNAPDALAGFTVGGTPLADLMRADDDAGADVVAPGSVGAGSSVSGGNASGGVGPMAGRGVVKRGEPLDLTWTEGEAGDQVFVQIFDEQDGFLCGFKDDEGSGTIPAALTSMLQPGSLARISVHRVRELAIAQDDPRVDALLRFDFELTSALHVE
jgi:hypothetical protein